eukprot:jgi/Tetstr1/434810/TSEL_023860.t1
MDEESRGRTVTNLIRTLSPKIGVQILPADVRVVTRHPPKPAAADPAAPSGIKLPTTTGSVILRLARRKTAVSVLQTQWTGEGTAILDRQGRRCSTRLLGAPHLDDIERPVHQPSEAATDQPAATLADVLALAGKRAWVEYEANTDADNAIICPPTRTLLALMEDVCRDAVLALPFGDQSQGRVVIQVTVEHNEDREDQPTAPLPGVLPPALSKQFFRCALTAIAICITGPLANLELPTVEQLAEAIATTISQRTSTPPELQHAQWLTDTMTAAGVEMYLHHTEPTLLRVGDDNLCAISLGKEDEKSEFDPSELLIHPFSQMIREAGELGSNTGHNHIRRAAIGLRKKARKTAPASLALRATGRPIYTLTLQLTAHHHSNIGGTRSTDRTDQWRKIVSTTRTTRRKELEDDEENDIAMEVDTTHGEAAETLGPADISLDLPQRSTVHRTFREGTSNGTTERVAELHHLTTAATKLLAHASPASKPAIAANMASLTAESHQLSKPHRISIQRGRHPSQPTPAGKGKTATTAKIKKKQPRGRSRSDGGTRNRSTSKPRLSGARSSDSEWITDDDAAHPSNSSHQ